MVIFITGATHCGKTALAQRILEKRFYPYLSLDHLKMGLIRSGNTTLTVEDDEALTAYLWPIAAEIAKTAVENGQNLVIEGCYVPPCWQESFGADYLAHIRMIALAFSDDYVFTHYGDILRHANDVERRLDDGYATKELLLRENRRCREDFAPWLVLITGDYEKTVRELLR